MSHYTITDDAGWEEEIDTDWARESWEQTEWRERGVREALHRISTSWYVETTNPCCTLRKATAEEAHAWLQAQGHETPRELAEELGLDYEECAGLDDETVAELYKVIGGR